MHRMTLQQFRERLAPMLQWPVAMRRAPWLDDYTLEWSMQDRGVLDAGPRAFDHLQREHPEMLS